MTDLSFIASRLGLRALDLDEKTSDELFQLIIDELRTHDKELVPSGIVQFLQVHNCDLLPSASSDEWDKWITSFENGEKRILYDLLHWAFSNSDHLAQRAYLAPFLLPIEVPEELSNDDLYEKEGCYRELQHEFVDIHKTLSMKESDVLTMSELNAEIDIAAREKKQLLQRSQRTGTGDDSAQFQQLLSLTSTLREAQAREAALKQQKMEQLQLSQSVDDRLKGERRISSILSNNANSIDQCITELKTESEEAILKLETGLIPKRLQLEAAVAKVEGDAAKPSVPEDDIAYLEELLFQLDQKQQECNNKDTDGILKQANVFSSRLFALKQDASEKSGMNNAYSRENQRLRDELKKKDSEKTCGVPNLQENIKLYDEEKEEMLAAQKHNVELEGKKEDLTKKLQAIEQTLQREEEKGEISGYRKVSKTLDNTFQDTCVLNETKSEILEEMSAIVKSIGEKKQTLEPMVRKMLNKEVHLHFLTLNCLISILCLIIITRLNS